MQSDGEILYEIGQALFLKQFGVRSPSWDDLGAAYKELYEQMAREFLFSRNQ